MGPEVQTTVDGKTLTTMQALQRVVDTYNRLNPGMQLEPNKPPPVPALTDSSDLTELIKIGLIRGLPAAPDGKKWGYNEKTGKVVLK